MSSLAKPRLSNFCAIPFLKGFPQSRQWRCSRPGHPRSASIFFIFQRGIPVDHLVTVLSKLGAFVLAARTEAELVRLLEVRLPSLRQVIHRCRLPGSRARSLGVSATSYARSHGTGRKAPMARRGAQRHTSTSPVVSLAVRSGSHAGARSGRRQPCMRTAPCSSKTASTSPCRGAAGLNP